MKKDQKIILADACATQVGFTNRSKLEHSFDTGVLCIQQGDLIDGEALTLADLKRAPLDGNIDQFKVSGGEVLFRSRSGQAIANAVPEGLEEFCVVLNPVMILRPKIDGLEPAYLAWALNQPWVQAQLSRDVQGTAVKMIPKSALERVRIPLPPVALQNQLVEFDRLVTQEGDLLLQLRERRFRWAEAMTAQLLNAERLMKGAMQ